MATTRINAVTATSTTFAGDDYLPIDGNVNATRRILVTSLFASASAIGSVTPAAGTFTSLSGTNINGTLGATTPSTGAFTTLSATGLITAAQATAASATDGLLLKTSSTASAGGGGGQKWSPAVSWEGQGWKTATTAASQPVKWRAYVQPSVGLANPTSEWLLQSSVNNGAYTTQLTISESAVTASSVLKAAVIQSTGNGTGGFKLYNYDGYFMTMLHTGGASYDWTLYFDNQDSGNRTLSLGGDLTLTGANTVETWATGTLQATTSGQTSTIALTDTGANGANLKFVGDGATTPNKYIRAQGGQLQFLNSAYSAAIATLTDAGSFSAVGINSTPIGATTPSTGTFTTLSDTIGDVRIVPQNSQSIDYTLVVTDSGKQLLHPGSDATPRTFTIPSNVSVPWSLGTAITFVNQQGAGNLSIAINSDTMRWAPTGSTGTRTLTANGVATVLKIGSTDWLISGAGLT